MTPTHIQKQILYKAIKDPVFAKDIFSQLPTKSFDEEKSYAEIALLINRHYQTKNEPLGKEALLVLAEDRLFKQQANADKQQEQYAIITDIYTVDPYIDTDESIQDNIMKYVRKTLSQNVILKAVAKGNLEEENTITDIVQNLQKVMMLSAGSGGDSINFFQDVERKAHLLSNMNKNKFSTGFRAVDEIADGGLSRGELGLINASYGNGKTTFGVNLAYNYIVQGLNVLFLPLEEKLDRMVLRFEQRLSKQPKSSIMAGGQLNRNLFDVTQQAYQQFTNPKNQGKGWGEFIISKYMPRTLSPSGLEQEIINQTLVLGKQIDVVIIDYPDLMDNPFMRGSDNESRAGGMLVEEIRRISQEYNFVGWVFSQLNRSGTSNELRTAQMIEGSKQKLNPVEIAMTINQTPQEQEANFTRLYVDKLRNRTHANFDRQLVFRYVDEFMQLRDITEEERFAHQAIISTMDESVTGYQQTKKKEHTREDAINAVNDFNQTVQPLR